MIRSSCLILATAGCLVAISACAAGGDGDDDDKTKNTYGGAGGSGNGTGFGGSGQGGSGVGGSGQGGSGVGGTGQGGSGFGGSGQGGVGGSGQGGTAFGGSSGTAFGGASGAGTGGAGQGGTAFGGASGAGTGGAGGGAPGTIDLIDDMELGTGSIPATKGRVGAWYTYNDKTTAGTQTPTAGMAFVVDPGGFAGKCARTQGSGFTVWGAGMGVDLNNPGGTAAKGVYTGASANQGITFYAKGTPFRIKVLIPATTPTAEGGTCTGAGCGNNHGFIVNATATWTSFQVPFSSLTQETWAEMQAAPFSSAAIIGIQFQVPKDAVFDFAIDNLGFY